MEQTLKILIGIAVIIATSLIIAYPVQLLWNWLMPVLFGLVKITFWQAMGLYMLCSILFQPPTQQIFK